MKHKIFRITTVASTMNVILKGQLNHINQYYDVTGVTTKDDLYFEEIAKREKVSMVPLTMSREISPVRDLSALWRLYRLMRKEKPQIVHAQTPKAGLIGMLAGWLARVPVRIVSVVGVPKFGSETKKGKLLQITDGITYRCAHYVAPNSQGLEHYLREQFPFSQSKLRIIGKGSSNGIDTQYFAPTAISESALDAVKKQWNINNEGRFTFCFVGRITKDKGIHELVSAFVKLYDIFSQDQKPYLIIVGPLRKSDDPISEEVAYQIKNHPDIRFVGLQKDIRPFLALSNCFVFPSYREGLPGVLLQAGAMGLPIIASDIIGNREIVLEGKNGLLFESKCEEGLLSAMKTVLENSALRNKLTANARSSIENRYEQQYFWKCLIDFYKEHHPPEDH